jgi:hypothetical protein
MSWIYGKDAKEDVGRGKQEDKTKKIHLALVSGRLFWYMFYEDFEVIEKKTIETHKKS